MSVAGPSASSSRLRQETSLPAGLDKASRKLRNRKGKGKDGEPGSAAARILLVVPSSEGPQSTPDIPLEEVDWEWTTLTDTSVVRHPPVFTKDGSYFFTIVGSSVKIHSTTTGQTISTLSSSLTGHAASRSSDPRGHSDIITGVALHPENPFQVITSSLDGSIKIWDFLDAVLLQTIDLGQPIFRICVHQKFAGYVFVSAGRPTKRVTKGGIPSEENASVLRVSLKLTDATTQSLITKSADILSVGKTRFPVGIGISASGDWLAVIGGHKAYVAQTSSLKAGFTKFVSPERLTCIAFHPSEDYFATGDDKGNIRSWYCLREEFAVQTTGTEKRAQTTTLHWHAHAVSTLAFTPNGAYLLSGGEESVLVIWQLQSGKKEFVPRLGAPITSLVVAKANMREEEYLLVLADATLVFVSSATMKISRTFSRMKLDTALPQPHSSDPVVPLAVHTRSSTLLLPTSNPSSLQAYSLTSSKVVSEVEVSSSNRVSKREDTSVEASRVLSCTVSADGNWMATVDAREGDDIFHGDVCLKIWWWDWKAGYWILNTRIDRPHRLQRVTSISFNPASKDRNGLILATTGEDGVMKTWRIRTTKTKTGEIEDFWVARSAVGYRSEIPSHACWSPDGSLLVVAFGSSAILYDPTTNAVKNTLTSPAVKRIKSTAFIGQSGRYLLVIGAADLILWDLLTQTVCWQERAEAQISWVVPHPWDEVFAVLVHAPTNVKNPEPLTRVFIFGTKSAIPTRIRTVPFRLRNVIWHPFSNPVDPMGFELIGITYTWSLVLFGDQIRSAIDPGDAAREINDDIPGRSRTLFQDIFGESAFKDLTFESRRAISPSQRTAGTSAGGAAAKLFGAPAYIMPPLETMFDSVMDGFLQVRKDEEGITDGRITTNNDEDEEAVEMDVEDGPMVVGAKAERIVDSHEMGMFIDLFRQHAVKAPPSGHSAVNGVPKLNGAHQPNGINHSSTALSGSVLSTKVNGATPRPSKVVVQNPVADPVDPSSPATTGKKRKKSQG